MGLVLGWHFDAQLARSSANAALFLLTDRRIIPNLFFLRQLLRLSILGPFSLIKDISRISKMPDALTLFFSLKKKFIMDEYHSSSIFENTPGRCTKRQQHSHAPTSRAEEQGPKPSGRPASASAGPASDKGAVVVALSSSCPLLFYNLCR